MDPFCGYKFKGPGFIPALPDFLRRRSLLSTIEEILKEKVGAPV
jgi:hypothetical protein